jgi:antirestriction protein ArdC
LAIALDCAREFSQEFFHWKALQRNQCFPAGLAGIPIPIFLTFLRAKELAGHVRKDENGLPVIKVGTWSKKDDGATSAEHDATEVSEQRKFLRLYTVFNACQIEGIEFPALPKCETFTESAMAENARRVVAGMPRPPVINEGRKSFPHYVPETDTVEMPSRETFRAEW